VSIPLTGLRRDRAVRIALVLLGMALVPLTPPGTPRGRAAEPADAPAAGTPTVLVDGLHGPLRVAVAPTGQSLYVLRVEEGDVLGLALDDPARRWTAVASRPGVRPLAIGAVDSGTLALVVREGDALSIRAHRLAVPGEPPGETEVQAVPLGVTSAPAEDVRLTVSPARDWLAVSGLPDPLPRVARATITGTRLGGITERRCPRTSVRPTALAVGNHGEWILFDLGEAEGSRGPARLAWYSASGAQRLLALDTGLERVIDVAVGRETGLLWALVPRGSSGGTHGLCRVDAALVDGRQVARSVSVAELAEPTGIVCLARGDVIVAEGTNPARVLRFAPQAAGQEGR